MVRIFYIIDDMKLSNRNRYMEFEREFENVPLRNVYLIRKTTARKKKKTKQNKKKHNFTLNNHDSLKDVTFCH